MHADKPLEVTDLAREELLRLVGIFMGDLLVHYGMWFTETVRHHGIEIALDMEAQVLRTYFPGALKRLAPHFGIEMGGDIPQVLASKSREELLLLIADIAKTWVTSDGLWFQALEDRLNMHAAKQVNDTCWSHFAHLEAHKIRNFLELGPFGGLPALEKALRFRIYSSINAHEAAWDDDGTLLFKMTECRVQSARRRKEMEDYSCKSAGIIEYSDFARSIDPRINTVCVSCPPDPVPEKEFCTWRFQME